MSVVLYVTHYKRTPPLLTSSYIHLCWVGLVAESSQTDVSEPGQIRPETTCMAR